MCADVTHAFNDQAQDKNIQRLAFSLTLNQNADSVASTNQIITWSATKTSIKPPQMGTLFPKWVHFLT